MSIIERTGLTAANLRDEIRQWDADYRLRRKSLLALFRALAVEEGIEDADAFLRREATDEEGGSEA